MVFPGILLVIFIDPFYGTDIYGICQNLGGRIIYSTHNHIWNPIYSEYKRLRKI